MTTIHPETVTLTAAQAMVRWLSVQFNEEGDRFVEGAFCRIPGHANLCGRARTCHVLVPIFRRMRGRNRKRLPELGRKYARPLLPTRVSKMPASREEYGSVIPKRPRPTTTVSSTGTTHPKSGPRTHAR